jgi:hypothetical protein
MAGQLAQLADGHGARFIRLGGAVRFPLSEVLRVELHGQPTTAPKR